MNVPLDVKLWMVYSPTAVTVPPVAREEEHEELDEFELGGTGAAGAGLPCAGLGSLYTRTCPALLPMPSFPGAPMATYFPLPASESSRA